MLAIRLQRMGKKNRPSYRVVLSKKRDLYGNHNEILGNYDPVANPKTVNLKADRIKYWTGQGAQPSATVHNLLVSQGIIEGKKVKAWAPKKKSSSAEATADVPKKTEEKTEEAPQAVKPEQPKAEAKPAPEEKKDEPPAEDKKPEQAPKVE